MGLLTELLYPPRKTKQSKTQDKNEADQGANAEVEKQGEATRSEEKMPPPIHYFTMNGEVPNGAVPSGRLAVEINQAPHPPAPPADPPNGGMASITQRVGFFDLGLAQHTSRMQITENHYHWHFHHSPQPPNADPPKSHVRFISNGVQPSGCYPQPFKSPLGGSDLIVPLSTSLKEMHEKVGSNLEGRGFQVVHKVELDKWAPGPIFEWGKGDGGQQIGETLLGKGKPGKEIYLCSWERG